jgi:hypothetical protein
MLLPAVEVIPWDEAVALLPPDPPPHPKATVNINVAPAQAEPSPAAVSNIRAVTAPD